MVTEQTLTPPGDPEPVRGRCSTSLLTKTRAFPQRQPVVDKPLIDIDSPVMSSYSKINGE
jgi:hypothetical protein